jgi:ligand-binding sensor domain-containing protein
MKKAILILITLFINIINTHAQTTYWYNYTSGNYITSIVQDDNIVWIATGGGLVKVDLQAGDTTFFNATNSGIPQNAIHCMDIAPNGVLWVGTASTGLASFDGENWMIYNTSNSDLASDKISDLAVDQEGTVWLTGGEYDNYTGLVRFNSSTWTNFTTNSSDIPTDHICAISFDDSGTIVLGTYGKGLVLFDGIDWINYHKNNSELPGDYIHAVEADQNGTIWMGYSEGAEMGLASFNGTIWNIYDQTNSGMPFDNPYDISTASDETVWVSFHPSNPYGVIHFDGTNWTSYTSLNSGLIDDHIDMIRVMDGGVVWIGTKKGLVCYNGTEWTTHNTSNSGIPYNNNLGAIATDSSNVLWIGSNDGLLTFDGNVWQVFNTENTNLETNYLSSPVFDSEGLLWLRTSAPLNLASFDGNDFTIYEPPSYVYGKINGSIVIDQQDKKFFRVNGEYLTSNGIVSYYKNSWHKYDSVNTGFNLNTLSVMAFDTANTLWAGVYDYLISYDIPFWNAHIVPNNGGQNYSGGASAIKFDNNNILWTAFYNGGLHRWDGEEWTAYKTTNSEIPSDNISDISFDHDNRIWIATDAGLAMLNDSEWTIYTQANSGLPCDIVYSVTIDQDNNKWIVCHNSGLTLFNEEGLWTSGTEEKTSMNRLHISPNPVNDKIRIEASVPLINATLYVFDVTGRLVKQMEFSEKKTYDIRLLPSGIYLVNILDGKALYSGKFIKH